MMDIAVVEGRPDVRGFRAGFGRHAASAVERALLPGGGPATAWLNRRVPGSYANDWFYQYLPDATLVSNDRATPESAASFAESMEAAIPGFEGKPYRFSPPDPGDPAYERAFGSAPFCARGGNNCINVPRDLHEQRLGGPHLQTGPAETPFDVTTGAGPRKPGEPPGASARAMDEWIAQSDEWFASRGLTRTRIGPTMLTRAASSVIRVGGLVLLVYGAVKTHDRIAAASPAERPVVVAEEADPWTGGWVAGTISAALGEVFICGTSGPGAYFCVIGVGAVGGVGGGMAGEHIGHELGEAVERLFYDIREMGF
jgi:hypothetical protein